MSSKQVVIMFVHHKFIHTLSFWCFIFCYFVESVLRSKSGSEEVLQEYHTTETPSDDARRKMVNILVANMIDNHV